MWATERSLFRSLLRRLLSLGGFIPIVGDLLGLIPIRYHFDFFVGDREVGGFERRFGIRDRYILDLSGDEERRIDRRVAIALAIAMDALQARWAGPGLVLGLALEQSEHGALRVARDRDPAALQDGHRADHHAAA